MLLTPAQSPCLQADLEGFTQGMRLGQSLGCCGFGVGIGLVTQAGFGPGVTVCAGFVAPRRFWQPFDRGELWGRGGNQIGIEGTDMLAHGKRLGEGQRKLPIGSGAAGPSRSASSANRLREGGEQNLWIGGKVALIVCGGF